MAGNKEFSTFFLVHWGDYGDFYDSLMITLIYTEPGLLEYAEQTAPAYSAGDTILRSRRIRLCGTDKHIFEGTQPYFNYPRVLGHELAAEIVQTVNPDFKKGEMVTFIPNFKEIFNWVILFH